MDDTFTEILYRARAQKSTAFSKFSELSCEHTIYRSVSRVRVPRLGASRCEIAFDTVGVTDAKLNMRAFIERRPRIGRATFCENAAHGVKFCLSLATVELMDLLNDGTIQVSQQNIVPLFRLPVVGEGDAN